MAVIHIPHKKRMQVIHLRLGYHYIYLVKVGYNMTYGKMYYFKLYNDGILVRDMVPCKDMKGIVCMYDRVENKFYYNSGSGSFTAGPEV